MKRAAEYLKRNSYIYITAFVLFVIGVVHGALGAAGIEGGELSSLKELAESFFGQCAENRARRRFSRKARLKILNSSLCADFVRCLSLQCRYALPRWDLKALQRDLRQDLY